MSRRNFLTTKRLIILTALIEIKTIELERAGVTISALEDIMIEILHLICEINGVKRNSDGVDVLCAPIFDFDHSGIGINKCLQLFYQRLDEIRQERSKVR